MAKRKRASKKYWWLAGIIILVVACCIGTCYYTRSYKIGALVDLNPENITKIVIKSGNGWTASFDTSEDVQKITAFLSEVKVHKELYYLAYTGWSYAFDIYYKQADMVTVSPGAYNGTINNIKYKFGNADYENLIKELD